MSILSQLRSLFRKEKLDAQILDEIRLHGEAGFGGGAAIRVIRMTTAE